METPSPFIRDVARRLLDLEAARTKTSDAPIHEAVQVCENLRISLTRFAGADGFASLMRRTLALAQAEVPSLNRVTLKPDCSIDGLESLAADASNGDPAAAIIAHLLGLLVTFIGEPLTLRLVREAWPDAPLD